MSPAAYPEFGRFVAALAADLRDNLARGAFADWLDEQGFLGEAGAVRALTWRVFAPDGGNWWWQGTDPGGVVSNKANVLRCLILHPAWATPPVPA